MDLLSQQSFGGSGFVASAVALDYYTPYQILAGRFLIGVLILSIVFYKRFNKTTRSAMIKGVILGVFLYLAFVLQTVGLQYTTPSKNAFLTAINVVIVPFIGFVIYKKKLDVFELIGAVMGVTGVAVLSLKLSSEINFGDMLTLACAFAFAFHIFYTARFVRNEDPVLITIIQMATAAIISIIVVLFKGETTFTMESDGLLPLIYLGIFSTEAFWGMLFSVLILSEILTGKMAIGAILILGAIIVSETKFSFLGGKKLYIEKKQNIG